MCWLDSAVDSHRPALILWHFNSVFMMCSRKVSEAFSCSALELRVSRHSSVAPQGSLTSVECVCVCVCVCVRTSPLRLTLCECVDTKGINGLEGTSWVLTGSVPWPHPLTLKHKHPPSSSLTSSVSFHWSISLVYLIVASAGSSICPLRHMGFWSGSDSDDNQFD